MGYSYTILMLLALAVVLMTGLLYWVILLWPVLFKSTRAGGLGPVRLALLQLTMVFMVADLIVFHFDLTRLLHPPLELWNFLQYLAIFSAFVRLPLIVGAIAGLTAMALWRLYRVSQESFIWSAGGIAAVVSSLLTAAWWSDHEQSMALAVLQPDCVVRYSFWHSLDIKGEEYQFDLHLMAFKDNRLYGWSYREMKLYPVPQDAAISGGTLAYCERAQGRIKPHGF